MRTQNCLRVLVVDDDELIVDAIRSVLEANGCAVTTAHSVGGARRALSRAGVELVFCDWNLGDETSEPLLRELGVALPDVPKILLTGSPPTQWSDLVERGLVQARITKPFELRELLQVVHEARVGESAKQ